MNIIRSNLDQKYPDNKFIILVIAALIFSGVFVSLFKLIGIILPINIVAIAIITIFIISALRMLSYRKNALFVYILSLFIFFILFKLVAHSPFLEWRSILLTF